MNEMPRPPLTPETLFARDTLWQSWLDVEAALARAQARLGMIPDWAAVEITRAADIRRLDRDALAADVARTLAPILSITRSLAAASGPAGDFVHWGATTQNVMQTGQILLLREADQAIRTHLAVAVEHLGRMARVHAGTLMAGRTNRQHALPITFGFKVAGWIEEMDRVEERLSTSAQRLFSLPFGGAVGAMHAYGEQGRELNRQMASDLGLRELLVPSRTVNDLFVEYLVQLALLAMTVERIMAELYRLMMEEVGEIVERLDEGTVGSSTMPQKINPKHVVRVISQAIELRGMAGPALECSRSSHEGDAVANQLLSSLVEKAVPLTWKMVDGFAKALDRIIVMSERMRENLDRSGGAIASEKLMMVLAPLVGRAQAHDLVHHVLEQAMEEGLSPRVAILADAEIGKHLTAQEIEAALDPAAYVGDSVEIAESAADLAARLARRFRRL